MTEAIPDFYVAIPARYAATRLPGKPLRLLAGKPLIEHVYRSALQSGARAVVVATDDARIQEVAQRFGATVCMTAPTHQSGTDRLAEVAQQLGWEEEALVVNAQGDEPLLPPTLIQEVAVDLAKHTAAGIATLCVPIQQPQDLFDSNVVKVVRDAEGYAQYFSRAPIPWHRGAFTAGRETVKALPTDLTWWRHIGLYAYRVSTLCAYPQLAPAPQEIAESLEQLRALHHGIRIHVAEASQIPPPGVDTETDLARTEANFRLQAQRGRRPRSATLD